MNVGNSNVRSDGSSCNFAPGLSSIVSKPFARLLPPRSEDCKPGTRGSRALADLEHPVERTKSRFVVGPLDLETLAIGERGGSGSAMSRPLCATVCMLLAAKVFCSHMAFISARIRKDVREKRRARSRAHGAALRGASERLV